MAMELLGKGLDVFFKNLKDIITKAEAVTKDATDATKQANEAAEKAKQIIKQQKEDGKEEKRERKDNWKWLLGGLGALVLVVLTAFLTYFIPIRFNKNADQLPGALDIEGIEYVMRDEGYWKMTKSKTFEGKLIDNLMKDFAASQSKNMEKDGLFG